MSATIWKYPLPFPADRTSIMMPIGAQILALQMQDGQPTIWAQVDPGALLETRRFAIYGTGFPLDPERQRYLGTFQMPPFVWHVYEEEVSDAN